ncbi:zinc finger protein 1-like [Schistocerca piceifrons]|uniref:zinc finger protein 1-like n=1 Tax=Schistocerca piceifrons TaxID=274613 RepID=UPI001F5F5E71|nr:zinc finger protein 1-like [Schistocerca piceifrons]
MIRIHPRATEVDEPDLKCGIKKQQFFRNKSISRSGTQSSAELSSTQLVHNSFAKQAAHSFFEVATLLDSDTWQLPEGTQESLKNKRPTGTRAFPVTEGPGVFPCDNCGKSYKWRRTLRHHLRLECGKEPAFQCPFCPLRSKRKSNISAHIRYVHLK